MFGKKKQETCEVDPGRIQSCYKVLNLEARMNRFKDYGDTLPAVRLDNIEAELDLWKIRLKCLVELLQGHAETNYGDCCNVWKSFNFDGVDFCPKCGNFLGYDRK